MKKILIAVLWIGRSIHNWGFTLGDFTHEYPECQNTGIAGALSIIGPIGVPAVLLFSQDRHWLFKPLTTEQRWEAFHEEFPSLDRAYFEREHD